jgi:hypothetical protein
MLDTMSGLDVSDIGREYEECNRYLEDIKDQLSSNDGRPVPVPTA